MKHLTIPLLAVVVLCATSCRKAYDCTCTGYDKTSVYPLPPTKKAEAKKSCDNIRLLINQEHPESKTGCILEKK